MDAADRAELDRLRRRAFDRAPDIDADPEALARLIALEERVRHEHAVADLPAEATDEEPGSADDTVRPRASDPPPAPPGPSRSAAAAEPGATGTRAAGPAPSATPPPRRTILTLAAGLAIVVAVTAWAAAVTVPPPAAAPTPSVTRVPMEGREAFSFAQDSTAVPLLQVPLDGSFGTYINLPSTAYVPEFPTSGEVDWAYPLGEYYGWDLWIAGAAGLIQREHCILVERGPLRRARCVPASLRGNAALIVSVPYTYVAPADRPGALGPNDRLGFWWHDDDSVDILIGAALPR
ncbi:MULTISPECIES: hypothetical protein [Microbacterium]|uniref:hypothetical protein n=1 Tax=Microbacterium TaxID=33882 RepID=UPI00146DAEA5|nr:MULTISPECIES: hypothetical protein [Microbacterium]